MKVDGYERNSTPALWAGFTAAPAAAGLTFLAEFTLSPVRGLPWDMAARSFFDAVPFIGAGWAGWRNFYIENGMLGEVQWRIHGMEAAAVVGFLVGMMIVLPRCGWRLKYGEQQISGLRLALPPTGKKVAAAALVPEVKRTGTRSLLAPGVPLPFEHEVKGIFLCGAPGSGKTATIKWLLSQWVDRGYRLVVLDAGKGDFISEWPSEKFYLLAPHDNRIQPGPDLTRQAKAWDIAADCTSPQDAGEFAERVIAESSEPQWSAGARLILQGCIVGLQITLGKKWGWRDLHEVVTKPDAELNEWMRTYFPDATRYTAIDQSGNANKNASSYLTNCCATVVKFTRPLSLAWGDTPREHRLSLRKWMLTGKGAPTIILGRSGQFSAMSAAWIGALFRLMNSVVQSPALGDDKNRRILFVLDEIRTIAAKGDNIAALSEFGRSKGVGLIIGVQSIDQLRDPAVWGDAAVDAFENVMQTKIFGKLMTTSSGRGGANALAEHVIGQGRFKRKTKQISTGDGRCSHSTGDNIESRRVVEPQFFQQLAPTPRGPRAAYLATEALCILDWPWAGWTAQRPAVIPARWIDEPSNDEKKDFGWTAEDPYGQSPLKEDNRPAWRRLLGL